MSDLTHSYFGLLHGEKVDPYGVLWKGAVNVNANSVKVELKCTPDAVLDSERLDAFASILNDITTIDVRARTQLRAYLMKDPQYIEYHIEEIPEVPTIARLVKHAREPGVSIIPAFVCAMQLRYINLRYNVKGAPIMLDYSIDPEESDQILAVEFRLNGDAYDVKWES